MTRNRTNGKSSQHNEPRTPEEIKIRRLMALIALVKRRGRLIEKYKGSIPEEILKSFTKKWERAIQLAKEGPDLPLFQELGQQVRSLPVHGGGSK